MSELAVISENNNKPDTWKSNNHFFQITIRIPCIEYNENFYTNNTINFNNFFFQKEIFHIETSQNPYGYYSNNYTRACEFIGCSKSVRPKHEYGSGTRVNKSQQNCSHCAPSRVL